MRSPAERSLPFEVNGPRHGRLGVAHPSRSAETRFSDTYLPLEQRRAQDLEATWCGKPARPGASRRP